MVVVARGGAVAVAVAVIGVASAVSGPRMLGGDMALGRLCVVVMIVVVVMAARRWGRVGVGY